MADEPYSPVDAGYRQTADPTSTTPLWSASDLYDGDKSTPIVEGPTYWQTHEYYCLDLGSSKPVGIIICYDNRSETAWYGANYDSVKVYKSDDGATWTEVEQIDGPPRFAGGFTLELSSAQTARFFMVWNLEDSDLSVAGGPSIRITELEFYPPAVEYVFKGIVQLKGSPVVRTVRAYLYSTGELFSSGQSGEDGSFELSAPDSTTACFVIAFDVDSNGFYNALVYDRVTGVIKT